MRRLALLIAALFCAAALAQEGDGAFVPPVPAPIGSAQVPALVQPAPIPDGVQPDVEPQHAAEEPVEQPTAEPPVQLAPPKTAAASLDKDLPPVAVYVTGDVPDNEKKAFGTRMLASLINSGRYKGIERSSSFLAEIEKEQEKQRSGAIDDGQISKLGKQFGVKFVCIADITPAYGAFQVSARIVNVETAEVAVIGDATSKLKTIDDLTRVSGAVVSKMFGEAAAQPDADVPPRKTRVRKNNGFGFLFANIFNRKIDFKQIIDKTEIRYYDDEKDDFVDRTDTSFIDWKKKPYHQCLGISWVSDITYAGIAVDALFGSGVWSGSTVWKESAGSYLGGVPISITDTIEIGDVNIKNISLSFGIFGRYPVVVSDNMTWFPIAGIYYEADWYGDLDGEVMDFSDVMGFASEELWFKFGVGLDVALGEALFIRPEVQYGIEIPIKGFFNGAMAASIGNFDDNRPNLGHGLTARVILGWSKKMGK